jgi:hypothetical protein
LKLQLRDLSGDAPHIPPNPTFDDVLFLHSNFTSRNVEVHRWVCLRQQALPGMDSEYRATEPAFGVTTQCGGNRTGHSEALTPPLSKRTRKPPQYITTGVQQMWCS